MAFINSKKIQQFLKTRDKYWWLAIIITLIALFVRVYRLPSNVMFQGDQGRDALIVSKIFKEKDLVFIGPVTSVGNMYLGPFYYYFMLPFLWLSYPSPMGPVYAVVLANVLAVFGLYLVGKKMFNEKTGVLAALFFALSVPAVIYSRFSWNPNLAQVISVILVYFTWKAWKEAKYWIGALVCLALLIQLHYITLLAAAGAGLCWIVNLFLKLKNAKKPARKKEFWKILKPSLIGGGIFLLSLTPLLLFDLKHQGLNTKAFLNLISDSENFSQPQGSLEKIWSVIKETEGRAMHILVELNFGTSRWFNRIFVLLLFLILGWRFKQLKQKNKPAFIIILIYLIVGIIGTATYQHTIFDHYITYLFPITALVYAICLTTIKLKLFKNIFASSFIIAFLFFNLLQMPFKPNYSMQTAKKTAMRIQNFLPNQKPYNIVLFSESKDIYGLSYRYFLSTYDHQPLAVENHHQAENLIIIDEFKNSKQVTNTNIYEILTFPNKTIKKQTSVENGPNLYLLTTDAQ